MIDLAPLRDALASLTESRVLIEESEGKVSEPMRLLMQRGYIQAFEYTFSLAVGMMERFLVEISAVPDKRDLRDFRELIRVADENGLLLSPFSKWKDYREARNLTSHTYNRTKAAVVAEAAPGFEREVIFLLAKMQEKLA